MRLTTAWVVLVVGIAMLAGCGEPSQNVQYKDGRYAGKPDTPAWQGDAFKGSRDVWEAEIKQRTRLQDEYTRLTGGG